MLRVKGTHDWVDLTHFNMVIDQAKRYFSLYNFQEIATPLIEPVELFQRSLGSATDIISKEMFLITPRNQDDQICLRPEGTASVVRAFIENNIQTLPWKVFTWGPMFRYERPQKGRCRQFHQISMEIVGAQSIAHDAQLIMMLDRYFHEQLTLNNYALVLNFLGCAQDRVQYKERLQAFLHTLDEQALCAQCVERQHKNILRIFDCKNESCQQLYTKAPHTADFLCITCDQEWTQLKHELEQLSVSFAYRPTLVRGLDYYTKTVFEFVSNDLGAQNAFCGGGRYDHLVKELGGKQDLPSLGAAIGIERVLIALQARQDTAFAGQRAPLHVIIPLSKEQKSLALMLADMLRAHNLTVDVLLDDDSLKSMMRQANKMGALYALLIGSEEQEHGSVTIKHMVTGKEERVPQITAAEYLKR